MDIQAAPSSQMRASPSSGPSPPASGPSQSSKGRAHLDRIRDNQRRSRARRKEYLQELEDKFRQCEQIGVKANQDMQVAARRVLEENNRLRAILRERGVSDEEMDAYLGAGSGQGGASDGYGSGSSAGITVATGTVQSTPVVPDRKGSGPVQELTGMLTARRPCCPGSNSSESCCPTVGVPVKQEAQEKLPVLSSSIMPSTMSSTGGTSNRISPTIRPQARASGSVMPLSYNNAFPDDRNRRKRSDERALFSSDANLFESSMQPTQQHQSYLPLDLHQRNAPALAQDTQNLRQRSFDMGAQSYSNPSNSYMFPDLSLDPLESADMSSLLPPDVQAQFLRGLGYETDFNNNQPYTSAPSGQSWNGGQQDMSTWQNDASQQDGWRS